MAVLYLIAFWSTLNQFRALLGEHGLLPAPRRPGRRPATGPDGLQPLATTPTSRLVGVAVVGMVLAAALVAGIPQAGPPWVPLAGFLVLYGLYMSIVNIGQTFYGFGWERLLLEAGFMVGVPRLATAPPMPVILLMPGWCSGSSSAPG